FDRVGAHAVRGRRKTKNPSAVGGVAGVRSFRCRTLDRPPTYENSLGNNEGYAYEANDDGCARHLLHNLHKGIHVSRISQTPHVNPSITSSPDNVSLGNSTVVDPSAR